MQTQLVRPLPCCHTDGFLPFVQQRGAHILLKDHQNGFCHSFAVRTGFVGLLPSERALPSIPTSILVRAMGPFSKKIRAFSIALLIYG